MQKSKFKNYQELEKSFDEVYDVLNSFIANEGILYDTTLYGVLESARIILANAPWYFRQYNYEE